jgi:site-specific DNA recombinase
MVKELGTLKTRVALYIRVSTDEQANEGFSIEAQKRRLISYADSQDWTIVEIYIDDGYSAKDLKRPQMKQLIEDVTNTRFDILLVYRLDRMTRSTTDCDYLLKLFDEHQVKFQSSSESFETRTATGRLFIRLVADIAQWERENIAERVRFGMEQKAMEGKKPGGVLAFGYDSEQNLILEEVKMIKDLRELYVTGDSSGRKLGYMSIARTMNQAGKLRRGFEWSSATVQSTLENPFYAGIIQYGGKLPNGKYPSRKKAERVTCVVAKGSHPAIWTEDEFKEHTDLMKMRSGGGYSRKQEYWFTGILRCGKCGSSMNGRMSTKRSRKDGSFIRTPYYFCQKRHEGRSCDMPMFRQIHVEQLLMNFINVIKADHRVMLKESGKLRSVVKQSQNKIAEHQRELVAIQERKKKWQYMFVESLITSNDLRERTFEENQKEEFLKEKLAELKQQVNPSVSITEQLIDLSVIWPELNDGERGEIVRTIFSEIVLFTPLGKIKGIKGMTFESSIKSVKYN